MSRYGRLVLFAAFVVVVGGAAWTQYAVQRNRADESSAAARANTELLGAVVQTENAVRDATVVHDPAVLGTYASGRVRLRQAERTARAVIGDDPELRERLHHEIALVDDWADAAARDVAAAASEAAASTGARAAAARDLMLERIRTANSSLARAIDQHNRDERDAAGMQGIVALVVLCAAFAVLNWALFVRTERRESRDRDRQLDFAERLQTARSEDDAHAMLARHLESVAPDTMVVVTGDHDASAAGRPITAHGERIGTVIIRSKRDLRPGTERWVHDSILRAAPVLGTLRMLAEAQARAATDALTGLGNRRLVEDALARMAAQSRRTGDTFAVAMIDVDRFKSVNDTFGHEAGDTLLVAIADVLTAETREYDIVGRRGGDEFIVLLAGLDGTQAATAMDRCRGAIARLRLDELLDRPGVEPTTITTASFGVAASNPGQAADSDSLVRAADEAVYEAKARGGNCVVTRALARV
jgi:diguanylate cyclase (GGDEF)-like protein